MSKSFQGCSSRHAAALEPENPHDFFDRFGRARLLRVPSAHFDGWRFALAYMVANKIRTQEPIDWATLEGS